MHRRFWNADGGVVEIHLTLDIVCLQGPVFEERDSIPVLKRTTKRAYQFHLDIKTSRFVVNGIAPDENALRCLLHAVSNLVAEMLYSILLIVDM
jgi:hypothetical protein